MKTIFILVMLISVISINAQEKDSSFAHYGLITDFNKSIADLAGFKYRPTLSVALFLKGGYDSGRYEREIALGNYSSELDVYTAVIGLEYTVFSIDNISFYTLISVGTNIHNRKNVEYNIIRKWTNFEYIFETGIGAEYFISQHLSIGGSQIISLSYFKDEVSDNMTLLNNTQTQLFVVDTKITLSFYF